MQQFQRPKIEKIIRKKAQMFQLYPVFNYSRLQNNV